MLLRALNPKIHHSKTIQAIRMMPQVRTANGASRCLLSSKHPAVSWVRPLTISSTKPEGMKLLKNTSGQGILLLSMSSNAAPPQLSPAGSIHIMQAPITAPKPMKKVNTSCIVRLIILFVFSSCCKYRKIFQNCVTKAIPLRIINENALKRG